MTEEEYKERVLAIERETSEELEAAIAAFPVFLANPNRSVRYRYMARQIAHAAVIERVESREREKINALDRIFYELED